LHEGIQAWWNYFDADMSDRIELKEFLGMLENLEIYVEHQRHVYLMFSLFDRRDKGYFNFEQFDDIISENMEPDFLKIAKQAKIRYV